MPKSRVKFGPERFVFQNNPKWGKELAARIPSHEEQLLGKDDEITPARRVDLYHLSQQPFANNIKALKRWFLTAFVIEEDTHFLNPPDDPNTCTAIDKEISEINDVLVKAYHQITLDDLESLKKKLLTLFKTSQWLGVALGMVDKDKLSIDILNTLIVWQASVIQFGEKVFSLYMATEETPLRSYHTTLFPVCLDKTSLHQIIYADVALTLDHIQNTQYGKIKSNFIVKREITLRDFRDSIIHYKWIDDANTLFHFQYPSSYLLCTVVAMVKNQVIPILAFGYLPYEAFNGAAFLSARPLQAYLPGAKGNRYKAHCSYLGPSLTIQHDYDHVLLPVFSHDNRQQLIIRMRLASNIANAQVQLGSILMANAHIDGLYGVEQNGKVDMNVLGHEVKEREDKLFIKIYSEMLLSVGIIAHHVKLNKTNNKLYIESICKNKRILFEISKSEFTPLCDHYQQIQKEKYNKPTQACMLNSVNPKSISSALNNNASQSKHSDHVYLKCK